MQGNNTSTDRLLSALSDTKKGLLAALGAMTEVAAEHGSDLDALYRSRQTPHRRFDTESLGWPDVKRLADCLYVVDAMQRAYSQTREDTGI